MPDVLICSYDRPIFACQSMGIEIRVQSWVRFMMDCSSGIQ